MQESSGVSAVLRLKDFEGIEQALSEYDKTLNATIEYIKLRFGRSVCILKIKTIGEIKKEGHKGLPF